MKKDLIDMDKLYKINKKLFKYSSLLFIYLFMGSAVAQTLNSKQLSEVLIQGANDIRKQSPMKFDGVTTLTGAMASSNNLVYYYRLNIAKNEISSGFERTQKEFLGYNWCSAMQLLLSSGAKITGVYQDKNGIFIAKISVTKQDCNY